MAREVEELYTADRVGTWPSVGRIEYSDDNLPLLLHTNVEDNIAVQAEKFHFRGYNELWEDE